MRKIANRKLLFDGPEHEFKQAVINIHAPGRAATTVEVFRENFKEIRDLKEILSSSEFTIIMSECKVKQSDFLGIFKNQDNLKSYYILLDNAETNYLIIVSYGEFQPCRYMLFLEGIWEVRAF